MLRDTNLAKDIIDNDNPQYSLDGKIEPMFYNEGNYPVKIFGFTVNPGGQFSAGFVNSKTFGTVDISFIAPEEPNNIKKIICVYGTHREQKNC